MKKLSIISAILFMMFTYSCQKEPLTDATQAKGNDESTTAARGNEIPNQQAYYDSMLFTINLMEMPDNVSATLIAHNSGLNEIYASEDLDDPQTFHPVIDAIPGDGMNPMWLQMLIVFNPGYTPHQFYSDDEIDNAEASGEITLVNTGEVYRCSVRH